MDAEPTDLERANAAAREAIAAKQNDSYMEAHLLALGALGPGFTPWMKLCLIDADHRKTGDTPPVAVVFKVYRGEQKITEASVFLRRMPNGKVKKAKNYEELFGELLTEKHPSRTVEVRGEQVPVGRYELTWGSLEIYEPRSAAELASLRVSREAGKARREAEKWMKDNPLLAWGERQDEQG